MTADRLPDPYRVIAGDRVVVEDGPLRIGEVDWFMVYSADARGEGNLGTSVPTSAAWAPVRDGEGSLFEPIDGLAGQCSFVAAGGPGQSILEIPPDSCSGLEACGAGALAWVAAAPSGEGCRFLMTDTDSNEVVIEAEVIEWSSGASWSRDRETRLLVDTDCTWSVRTAEA
jgi:hypothetical protein